MSRNVWLWMPAVYVYVGCCWLCYIYMYLIYGEYFVNVHFSDIPHAFIPHFTLHSAEKIRIEFSANYPLTTFRIPQNTPSRFWVLPDRRAGKKLRLVALLCARLWRVDCVMRCLCDELTGDKLTVWRHDRVMSWLVAALSLRRNCICLN